MSQYHSGTEYQHALTTWHGGNTVMTGQPRYDFGAAWSTQLIPLSNANQSLCPNPETMSYSASTSSMLFNQPSNDDLPSCGTEMDTQCEECGHGAIPASAPITNRSRGSVLLVIAEDVHIFLGRSHDGCDLLSAKLEVAIPDTDCCLDHSVVSIRILYMQPNQ